MVDFFEDIGSNRNKRDIIKNISSIPSNYVGSKRRLLKYIWDLLEKHDVKFDSVFDAFSGSSMVSLLFRHMGKKVFCNDLLTSSAITAVSLLENNEIPLTREDINFLYHNVPDDCGTFVYDNYKDKFFTERECRFLDKYRRNVELLCGDKFYCGMDVIKASTLASIPNSNFSIYGKDLGNLRSTHKPGTPYWTEKWRDTTRKRRDRNNEIKFREVLSETYKKYKSAFSLFAVEHHINQHCFLGGRYYNGQVIANLEHRLKHQKSDKFKLQKGKDKEINIIPESISKFKKVLREDNVQGCVFNSDIIELLESKLIQTDLIYIDPPYGGSSSDYVHLYSFLEEYLYEDKLDNLEHIQKGGKRFSKGRGYAEQFETLLSLCGNFETWLLSYNNSSFADIDTITSIIKNTGKSNVTVFPVPIKYQYRKESTKKGIEYLILAV